MPDTNQTHDFLARQGEPPELPAFLNVLTILTLIGSCYELYTSLKSFFSGQKALEQLQQAQEKLENYPDWAKKMAGPEVMEMTQKSIQNKIPILVIGLVSIFLCVLGALQMRKLKKQGYVLWLLGELLPWVGIIIFIGSVFFKTFAAYFIIFPVLFIILYTTQRKYLVN
jgi:hypothetical protein